MQTKELINNEEIDLYLAAGDRDEIARAIVMVQDSYQRRIFSIIEKIAFSANQQDCEDIYQEFLRSVFVNAMDGKYESNPEKLSNYLVKIAVCRAKDWGRKKCCRDKKEPRDNDMLVQAIDEGIRGPDGIKEIWEMAHAKEMHRLVLFAIQELIPKLPMREKQVADIIFRFYEDSPDDNDIRDKIAEYHNEVLTTQMVRSARNRLYAKLREKLQSII